MGTKPLTPALVQLVAERFRVLSEPARLQLMNALRDGERSVSELVEATELGQANTSKHLQLLRTHGFVDRRKEGLYVYYRLADATVFTLCDLMCDQLERQAGRRQDALEATPSP